MKEKETPKSLYDYLEERGEAIGAIDGTLHRFNNLVNIKKLNETEERIWRD